MVGIKQKTYLGYNQLFTDSTRNDAVADVECPVRFNDDTELPPSLRIRFIGVVLADGEVEVLAT